MNECSAERKCWEHWQGWYARVTERDLELAYAYLGIRCAAALRWRSIDHIGKIEEACNAIVSLQNRQWREMVRKPFSFRYAPHLEKPAPAAKPVAKTLDDVLDLL